MSIVFCSLQTILLTIVLSRGQQNWHPLQCSLLLLTDFYIISMLQHRGQKFIDLQYLLMKNEEFTNINETKNEIKNEDTTTSNVIEENVSEANEKREKSLIAPLIYNFEQNSECISNNNLLKQQSEKTNNFLYENHLLHQQIKEIGGQKTNVDNFPKNHTFTFSVNYDIRNQISSIPLFLDFDENHQIQQFSAYHNQMQKESSITRVSQPKPIMSNEEVWQVGQKVGTGSTSSVYKAFNKSTGKVAAVKKVRITQDLKTAQLSILTKLNHPNIVEYYGYQKGPFELSLFMEFIPNTLESFYKSLGGPIPYQSIRNYTRQILNATKYLHQKKIIHKDIKCSNILFNDQQVVKLSDFGSSKQFDQSTSAAAYLVDGGSTFKASICWTAPEVLQSNIFKRKSDIWSIGCTCLQMATGKYPWSEKNFQNQLAAIWVIGTPGQIPEIPSSIPSDLQEFIKMCLVRDPDSRKTAEELLKTPFIIGI